MTDSQIITLRSGSDNYCYLIVNGTRAVAVDASDAATVRDAVTLHGLHLTAILSTHHHADHTGGNTELRKQSGCTVTGADRRIAAVTGILNDNESITIDGCTITCMLLPGHTGGSCAFYLPAAKILFTGDTLFYAGCGRLFECGASAMYRSLERIAALPAETRIYAGHEYTLDNLAFAQSVEPSNEAIGQRTSIVGDALRTLGYYGPSTMEEECATNPFMRTGSREIRSNLAMPDAPGEAVFAELRERKNRF